MTKRIANNIMNVDQTATVKISLNYLTVTSNRFDDNNAILNY